MAIAHPELGSGEVKLIISLFILNLSVLLNNIDAVLNSDSQAFESILIKL